MIASWFLVVEYVLNSVDLVRLNWNKIIEELKEIQKLLAPSDPDIVSVLENYPPWKWGKAA